MPALIRFDYDLRAAVPAALVRKAGGRYDRIHNNGSADLSKYQSRGASWSRKGGNFKARWPRRIDPEREM
jgi:hypothetical protein